MDYIKEPKYLDQVLSEVFGILTPIYEEFSSYQTVKLYDIRNILLNETVLSAVRTVFGVVINPTGDLLLIQHPKRGWEICGGHLTVDEVQSQDLNGALQREVIEESGYTIKSSQIAFLAHVENKEDSVNKELGCFYPRNAVMATYICDLGEKVSETLLDDIIQAQFFSPSEAANLVRSRNKAVITAL